MGFGLIWNEMYKNNLMGHLVLQKYISNENIHIYLFIYLKQNTLSRNCVAFPIYLHRLQ